jgi:23S rRNA (guanosine2251-2'-O)-methyltransferase
VHRDRRPDDDVTERRRGPTTDASETIVSGRRAVLEAVRAGIASRVLVARAARSTEGLRDVLSASEKARVPVRDTDRAELDRLAADHRGVVATVRIPRPIGERELAAWAFREEGVVVVLDGITDPQNLGAAARSAEAAGAAMLVTRTRRSADVTDVAIRASAGALLHLPHARVANVARALARLQEAGFTVVGLDEHAERTVFEEEPPAGKVAIVLGSEGEGLARLTRDACDVLVRLPMRGRVGSLNASASLAAALYAFVLPGRADRSDAAKPAS